MRAIGGMRGWAALGLASCLCFLWVQDTASSPHETIILSRNLSGSAHQYHIDGATVMSQENYKEYNLFKSIIILPRDEYAHLMVQFIYLDIPRQKPCRDYLHICEWKAKSHKCILPIVKEFCGGLSDLFPQGKETDSPHFISTSQSGDGIRIEWSTSDPRGYHRGFQVIVTAYLPKERCMMAEDDWKCGDGRCVNSDLHCDGLAHCPDGSDELVNCTRTGFVLPEHHHCGLWRSRHCPAHRWRERWFGLAIPMIIVMVLLLITIMVRIRKQLCRPPPGSSRRRRRRQRLIPPPLLLPRSQACTLQPMVGSALIPLDPHGVGGGCESHTIMLLPPPYSPPECIQYEPPIDGEPPPLYEECINYEPQQSKPTTPPESPQPHG